MNAEIYRNLKINILAYQPCNRRLVVLQTYKDCTTADSTERVFELLEKLEQIGIVKTAPRPHTIQQWDRDIEHKWIAEQIIELNESVGGGEPTLYARQGEILKRYGVDPASEEKNAVFEWVGKLYAEPTVEDFAGPEFGEAAEAQHNSEIRTHDTKSMTVTRKLSNGRTETMEGIMLIDQIADLDRLKDNDRMGLVAVQDEDSVVFWIVDNGDHWQDSLARYYREETWIDPVKHFKVIRTPVNLRDIAEEAIELESAWLRREDLDLNIRQEQAQKGIRELAEIYKISHKALIAEICKVAAEDA
jgi:hypothetical protein